VNKYQSGIAMAIRRKPIQFLAIAALVLGAQGGMHAHAASTSHASSARMAHTVQGTPADLCTLVRRAEIIPFLVKGHAYTFHVNQAPVTGYICVYEVKYSAGNSNFDHFTIALVHDKAQLLADGDYKPFKGFGSGFYLHRDKPSSPRDRDLAELLVQKGGVWFVMSVEFDVSAKRSALTASESLARRVLSRL
jgi:hypothetical protein